MTPDERENAGLKNSILAWADDVEVVQRDVADILDALGLGTHARDASTHEVVQGEVIPEILRLRGVPRKPKRCAWEGCHRLALVRDDGYCLMHGGR